MKKSFQIKQGVSRGQYFLLASLGFLFLILLWTIVSFSSLVRPVFLPTPLAIFHSTVNLYKNFNLLGDIWISFYRILQGFVLSVIISVPLGIYLSKSKKAAAFSEPLISFIRYIPTSALVPLFILWFGIGELEKVLFIFAGVAPYLTMMTFDVAAHAKKEYEEAAYTLGAKPKDIMIHVVIPQSLPGIWDAMRVMMGVGWVLIVLAEIIAATSGLGYLIVTSQRFLRTANVIAAIFIIGLLGLFIDLLFKFTYKKLFPWQEKT